MGRIIEAIFAQLILTGFTALLIIAGIQCGAEPLIMWSLFGMAGMLFIGVTPAIIEDIIRGIKSLKSTKL